MNGGSVALPGAMLQSMRQGAPVSWRERIAAIDLAPDLGEDIGSLRWFRGLATLTLFCVGALSFFPEFGPVYGAQASMPTRSQLEEVRTQMIAPLALGADSGRHMAANDTVRALAASPERPSVELTAILGQGDGFSRLLQRSGVGANDATRAMALVSSVTSVSGIEPGTPIEIVLGRRTASNAPRPLELIDFRARFDLHLSVKRNGTGLSLVQKPIAVDDTPLRIRGTVGNSLYQSARAAGAPPEAIQSFLKVIASRTSLSRIGASDEFDIIMANRRAETGEVEVGNLLFAGIERDGKGKLATHGSGSSWLGPEWARFTAPTVGGSD